MPLGDLVDRREAHRRPGLLSAIALVVIATAGAKAMLLAGMGVVGLLAVLVQILITQAAARLATPAQLRGGVVGTVTGGVVTNILAARSVASAIADFGGWRAVYMISALLMVAMIGMLVRTLPEPDGGAASDTYLGALLSVPSTFTVNRSCSFGACWRC